MRKKVAFLLLITLTVLLSGCSFEYDDVWYFTGTDSGGIVFKDDSVILMKDLTADIVMSGDSADVRMSYTLKNTSDTAVNTDAYFFFEEKRSDIQAYAISRNGTDLNSAEHYFSRRLTAVDFDNWENVIKRNNTRLAPFGDGSGFKEYRAPRLERARFGVEMWSDSAIFYYETDDEDIYVSDRQVFIRHVETGVFITPEVRDIADIYEYMLEMARINAQQDQLIYGESRFNAYLYNVSIGNSYTFSLDWPAEYVKAVSFELNLEPGEIAEYEVSYSTKPGQLGENRAFRFTLPPPRYLDNATITVTASIDYGYIHDTGLNMKAEETGDAARYSGTAYASDAKFDLVVTEKNPNTTKLLKGLNTIVNYIVAIVMTVIITLSLRKMLTQEKSESPETDQNNTAV